MDTDLSPQAAHRRHQAFRRAVIAGLICALAQLGIVTYLVSKIAENTARSPIEQCVREYRLSPDQCAAAERAALNPAYGVR